MSEAVVTDAEPAGKPKGKLGLILGLVGAIALGGGGFYATKTGLIDPGALFGGGSGGHGESGGGGHGEAAAGPAANFVAIEPILVSLGPDARAKHLRFSGQLDVVPEHAAEVASEMPRVVDALNTYLRAVEVRDLEDPAALTRLRAQMLRRVQTVTGEGQVRDLLVTEFVLN
ncbi:MAG: flagellar basal body-associated FliL family protein [Amaricoccus sp.]|uniref:flagellar basal body-associated FliL family protein n=1 Tax=Amaricoccus sp. TaxID=1872485 RepID=UPI0039E42E49